MEVKRPTLKIKFAAKAKPAAPKENGNAASALLVPELPGGLDITCASPASIVASIRAQGLGFTHGEILPDWNTIFGCQTAPTSSASQPSRAHTPQSTQQTSDSSRKRKHAESIDVVADATARLVKPKSTGTGSPPAHHPPRSGRGSRSDNEGSTQNPPPRRPPADTACYTPRGEEASSAAAATRPASATPPEHTRALTLTLNGPPHHPPATTKGTISPQLATLPTADSSPSPNAHHHAAHSPHLTSTSSKPSHPATYAPARTPTHTHTQTDPASLPTHTPAAPLTSQACQTAPSTLSHTDLLRLLATAPTDTRPFNLLSHAVLDLSPPADLPATEWANEHRHVLNNARNLKHKADHRRGGNDSPWDLEGLLFYCLSGIRFFEAYEYLRLLHRKRMKTPGNQKPVVLLQQTVAFQQQTVAYVKGLHAAEVKERGRPRVAVQALLLLCRRLLAISQSHLLLQQQQTLREAAKQMRETLAQRQAAAAPKDGSQQPSPDADSASSETLSTRDAVANGTAEKAPAAGAGAASGSAARENGAKAGEGREVGASAHVLAALQTMLHAADAWRATSEELQSFVARVTRDRVEEGSVVALHLYALGVDGGMGDILHTVQVACRVVDALYQLAKVDGEGSAPRRASLAASEGV